MSDERKRCSWASGSTDSMRDYHDREWGLPLHDDRALFEFICLEGAQAGLSWRTVLDKRAHYRRVFDDFDIARCAKLSDARIEKLLVDPGIIRNRLKVTSLRDNARSALAVIDEFGSLDAFLWSFVGGAPQRNRLRSSADVPAKTELSDRMSKTLAKRGSASSDRRSATHSCKRPAWSTITSSTASVNANARRRRRRRNADIRCRCARFPCAFSTVRFAVCAAARSKSLTSRPQLRRFFNAAFAWETPIRAALSQSQTRQGMRAPR